MKSPELRIDFEWLEGHHHYGAGALSEIAVFVNDVCLTELEDFLSKTVRGKMRVSAEALAVWLVDNWWRIHWESSMDSGISSAWKYAHCVAASGHGFAWPDITIYGDGKFIYIDTLPTSAMAGAPVRYLNHSLQYVPVDVFEQAVDNFATAVIDRLSCLNQASPLAELWQAVQGERRDGELASWRKLEAILGFDTDLSPAGLVDKLIAMRSEIGGGAVDEFAAAGQGATPEIVSFFTDRHIRSSATPVSLPDIPTESMSRMDSSPPWVSAAAAAASLRKHWKLGTHVSNEFFGDLFRLPSSFLTDQKETASSEARNIAVLYRGDNSSDSGVFLSKRRGTGRRFEIARLLADHYVADADDRLLPSTPTKTYRQKYQRAFAQELLCPYSQLIHFLNDHNDDDSITDAADFFQVSPLLVKNTLLNHGDLRRNPMPAAFI